MNWIEYRNKILQDINFEAFYLNELEVTDRRSNELKAKCPFGDLHEIGTDRLSFTVNLDRGVYYCHSCHSKGNIHTLLKHNYNLSTEEAWFLMGDELNIERPDNIVPERPLIEVGLVAEYYRNLIDKATIIKKVLNENRGLKDTTLAKFQLGWDKERITIPIYNEYNELVNIRRYKWDAETSAEKMKNFVDSFGHSYGELRIYGIENLVNEDVEEIIWCEGELDRIILEQHGFKAATPTSGAGSFKDEWLKYFKNKNKVYILQDNDEPGRNASVRLAEKLYKTVPVYIVNWPNDIPEKIDVTDYFVSLKKTQEDLLSMLNSAKRYKLEEEVSIDEDDAVEVHLAKSSSHELIGKRQSIDIMCSGKDTAPYIAPRKVKVTCNPTEKCLNCENAAYGGERLLEFNSRKAQTISLIQCTDIQQRNTIKEAAGIKTRCNSFNIEIIEYMNIEELRAIPQAETNFDFVKEHEYVVRKCYYIGRDLRTNQRYTMYGYSHAEPKTQYVTHIFDKAIPKKDRISSFEMNEQLYNDLQVFQVKDGQTVREKFEEIHLDFERNVTYIWDRRKVSMAIDLVYHTALNFYFQGQFVKRGWAELLIIGDSGQAKSTLVERLMRHYQLGELYSGESSRRTGLVYSFQQTQRRWFLIWGAWPLNDGGLIVIDEFGGIDEDEIASMSDVRSSGIAKAAGVITAETNARTRAIFLSNPRNGRPLSTETHGIQAILKLFGKAEDVRRLDMAVAVASGDVATGLINRSIKEVEQIPHLYDTNLCKYKILWCWSRKPDQIEFTSEATEEILKQAVIMGKKYTSKIPLVEPADQRLKLARLSIAAAGAVFSTPDGKKLIVEKDHVDFIVQLLTEVYDDKNLDYDKFSEEVNKHLEISEERLSLLRSKFALLPVHNPNNLARVIYDLQYFRRSDFQDATGLQSDDLLMVMSFLNINKIIERTMSGYRKTSNGIKLLKSIVDAPITKEEVDGLRNVRFNDTEF